MGWGVFCLLPHCRVRHELLLSRYAPEPCHLRLAGLESPGRHADLSFLDAHGLAHPVANLCRGEVRRGERRWTGAALAWLIPLLALGNGATSYLGLKTVANYSMFSNLRTEGGQTNHFLLPAGRFFVADYQNDLVRLEFVDYVLPEQWPLWVRLAGGNRWVDRHSRWLYEAPGTRVPFIEVRRALQLWREIGITNVVLVYEHHGARYVTADAFSAPALMRPLSFWERRLMAFRAVQDDGEASACRW